jgi:putative membrane protein
MKIQLLILLTALTFLPLVSQAAKPAAPTSCCAKPTSCCADVPTDKCPTPAQFADTVATVNTLEIALGKVAQTNASLPSVKKFGLHMVESHTELQAGLVKLAAAEKITLPTKLDAKHQAILKKLSALKGPAFDKTYIPAMVEGHTKVLAMFKNVAASCTDPAVKAYAKKNTKVIADHLKMAKKVQAEMKKADLL